MTLPRDVLPAVDHVSVRFVEEHMEEVSVRDGVVQPPMRRDDRGAMVTVVHDGGMGYAATADVSPSGLREAAARAVAWALRCASPR